MCSCFSLSAKCLCATCVSVTLYGCVPVHTYNLPRYGASKAVLNNAESLRLTTEQTQWGLSAQDIPFCIVLCCMFVPSHTDHYTLLTKVYPRDFGSADCMTVKQAERRTEHMGVSHTEFHASLV